MAYYSTKRDIINYSYIEYIIKTYAPWILDIEQKKKNLMYLFQLAMIHESMIPPHLTEKLPSNQRLEFLGDAVFRIYIAIYCLIRYDDCDVGFLTNLRIKLERGENMAELTLKMGLDKYIQYRNIELDDHILEDSFEAFVGAFYLNYGFKPTQDLVIKLLEKNKDFADLIFRHDNYKDILLQYFHRKGWGFPVYTEEDNGSVVRAPSGKILGFGYVEGSKKKSEQKASKKALIKVGVIVDGKYDKNWDKKIIKETKKEKEIDEADEKKKLSVFNPNNKLMYKKDIHSILKIYSVAIPKNHRGINYKTFHEAMTHKSYTKRKKLTDRDKKASVGCVKLQKNCNKRLRFLGDSVIHFIIGEYLYLRYPNRDEGFMTRLRSKLKKAESLYYLAKKVGIDEYVLLAQTIDVLYENRKNVKIVGGCLGSFVGAIYTEYGIDIARNFFINLMEAEWNIDEIAENETNYKEAIAKIFRQNKWDLPTYKILKEGGPDHAKIFKIGLYCRGQLLSTGIESSKKKAEQLASKKYIEHYNRQK